MTDVAIIGAGPYGLSLAAQLRAHGVAFRIFGKPMQFWQQLGPGRYLKSFGFATNVYAPEDNVSFTKYNVDRGLEPLEPCAIEEFARYGIWVQQQLLPNLEPIDVARLSAAPPEASGAFELELANGEQLSARRVVAAVGLKHFGKIPDELAHLPPTFVTHTALLDDCKAHAGKEVCILGAGQSALEAAALLHEAGAKPRVFIREGEVLFGDKMPASRPLWQRLRAPQSVLGPGLKNWALEKFPTLLHRAPDALRVPFTRTHLGPSGAWWLKDRVVGKVPIQLQTKLIDARIESDRVAVKLRDPQGDRTLMFDHVVPGTGFEVDLDQLTFLDAGLRRRIRRLERGPALDVNFQTSVDGLHFIGPASALAFGPLYRFVAGAAYAAPALAGHLASSVRPAPSRRAAASASLRTG